MGVISLLITCTEMLLNASTLCATQMAKLSMRNMIEVPLLDWAAAWRSHTTTPTKIVAEYGNAIVYGAGCGGAQDKNLMFFNSGVSASSVGHDQSMFALFSLDDTTLPRAPAKRTFPPTRVPPQNYPMPNRVFQDNGNTMSGGNIEFGITWIHYNNFNRTFSRVDPK